MDNLVMELGGVKLVSETVDLKSGLAVSPTFSKWVRKVVVDSRDAMDIVKSEAPVDNEEIVEWMQKCACNKIVLDSLREEYSTCSSRGAGRILFDSGDGYIPGVKLDDIEVESIRGREVRRRGYCVVKTPRGSFRVRRGQATLYANRDILVWAYLDPDIGSLQFYVTLVKWASLAKAPIDKRVRFASVDGKVIPNFFAVSTSFPTPVCLVTIGITSDKSQKLLVRVRGPKGKYHQVRTKMNVDISKGENEFSFYLFGLITEFTLEIQPADNTKTVLNYIDVVP